MMYLKRAAALLILLTFITAGRAVAGMPGENINNLLTLKLPATLDIAGEPVPIEREDVGERLDYELVMILGNAIQTSLWLKRMPRFVPEIEAELALRGLPDDLKYLPFIESSLRADAVSPAGAVGPWQFMAGTARDYKLGRDSYVDQRRDWKLSTRAALDFLKELHDRFGSWPLALAAYNLGPGRLRQTMEWQKTTDFFDLKLPDETERYVFRFLATKLLVTNAAEYGIDLQNASLYARLPVKSHTLDLSRGKVSLIALARAAGISYRYFLEINPSLTGSELPKGTHTIYIPEDKAEKFAAMVHTLSAIPPQTAAQQPKRSDSQKTKAKPAPPPVLTADPPATAQPAADAAKPAQEIPVLAADPPASTATAGEVKPPAVTIVEQTENVQPAQPKPDLVSYVVKKGDTLSSIARQFAVTVDQLVDENGLETKSIIKPGQELAVPPRQ